MLRKLAIIALLILYGLTGSVAAFADDGPCVHRGPVAHADAQPAEPAVAPGAPHAADQDAACCGFCHLSTVVQLLDAVAPVPLTRPERRVPAGRAPGWLSQTVGVPTPPPNLVSPL